MRYKAKGTTIRTENAARPAKQASSYLVKWISSLAHADNILDYGCGKLRYAAALTGRATTLTLVDSEIQISRIQTLAGNLTTIKNFAPKAFPNSRVLSIDEFYRDELAYDFILCANVLPVIPIAKERAKMLRVLSSRLHPDGKALFVSQYQNSYFNNAMASPNSVPHLDGWLLTTNRGAYYFGLLPKETVIRIVSKYGFRVVDAWSHGQSAYVIAATN